MNQRGNVLLNRHPMNIPDATSNLWTLNSELPNFYFQLAYSHPKSKRELGSLLGKQELDKTCSGT